MGKPLSSALEDYLEAIYRLEREKRTARVRDIAAHVGVTKSTVNAALRSLAAKGLVDYEPYELIVLTAAGRAAAADISLKHEILLHFLRDVLLLDDEKADETACKMEHAVDRTIMERIACFLAYVDQNSGVEGSWIADFQNAVRNGPDDEICKVCMKECMTKRKV